MGQNRKSALDARDVQHLRRNGIKNWCLRKSVNMTQTFLHLIWAKAPLKWVEATWKTVLFTLETTDAAASGLKSSRTSTGFVIMGEHYYGRSSVNIYKGNIDAEWSIRVLDRQKLVAGHHFFHQDNIKPHVASVTKAWLRHVRAQTLSRPFPQWKHLVHHKMKNTSDTESKDSCWVAQTLYQTFLYQNHSNSPQPCKWTNVKKTKRKCALFMQCTSFFRSGAV